MYANHGRTWLWTGCASGHGSGLLVNCVLNSGKSRNSCEPSAPLRGNWGVYANGCSRKAAHILGGTKLERSSP
jgi:hypothetical protein